MFVLIYLGLGNGQECSLRVTIPSGYQATVTCDVSTESCCDHFGMDGSTYSGTTSVSKLLRGVQTMSWSTDQSVISGSGVSCEIVVAQSATCGSGRYLSGQSCVACLAGKYLSSTSHTRTSCYTCSSGAYNSPGPF